MSNDDNETVPVDVSPRSSYGVLLMTLHTAKRRLIMQIEDAKREGTSTVSLERDLRENHQATHRFLGYMKGHASATQLGLDGVERHSREDAATPQDFS